MTTVLITGAAGNIGTKLREHSPASAGRCGSSTPNRMPIVQFRWQIRRNGMKTWVFWRCLITPGGAGRRVGRYHSLGRRSESANIMGVGAVALTSTWRRTSTRPPRDRACGVCCLPARTG
jgi:hypothetical protein